MTFERDPPDRESRPPSSRFPPNMPPLPRSLPRPESVDAASGEPHTGSAGALRYSVAPTALDSIAPGPPLHHGLKDWTALLIVAGAALLLSPMLVGRHGESPSPEAASTSLVEPGPAAGEPGAPPEGPDTAIYQQFIQIDEILITATDDEDVPGAVPR